MKYIIDIPKTVGMGILGSVHYTYFDGIQCQTIVLKSDEIEELNSDYINEHYGDLQDDAYERGHGVGYQKGFEDGKAVSDKGCEGCMYQDKTIEHHPCDYCRNAYLNQWQAKTDDEIKVGDEVAFHHDDGRPDTVVVVTYIGQDGFIDGMDGRGTQYAHKNPTKWTKTGRHFDISSILKEMQS